jgi:putative glutamine amidotransferase
MQEIVVAFGGSLRTLTTGSGEIAHSEDISLPRDQQYLARHVVLVEPDGLLSAISGGVEVNVNSLHRQAVASLGPRLRCEAYAVDGVLEAVSHPDTDLFVLGVQWHPEWYALRDSLSLALFRAFGDAVRSSRQRADFGTSVVLETL